MFAVSPGKAASRLWLAILICGLLVSVSPDARAQSPLVAAVERGDAGDVRRLLESGVDADHKGASGRTALWVATEAGRDAIVRQLLTAGADPRQSAYEGGMQPIHMAIQRGHAAILWLLVDAGAEIHAAYGDEMGGRHTTLTDAIQNGRTEIALELIRRGADAKQRHCPGESGCHSLLVQAARTGNLRLVRALLQAGNDVNPPDETLEGDGSVRTLAPLIAAALSGRAEVVAALLESGAEVGTRNNQGCSALDYATLFKHAEAAAILRQAGASADKTRCREYAMQGQ